MHAPSAPTTLTGQTPVRQGAVARWRRPRLPIATKMMASFLAIILLMSLVFVVLGVQLIGNRVVQEAQERVANDLNAAREIYLSEQRHIADVVRLTAERPLLRDALLAGDPASLAGELHTVMFREGLSVLTMSDAQGRVLLRAGSPNRSDGSLTDNRAVAKVIATGRPAEGTSIASADDLRQESVQLAVISHVVFVETAMARPRPETDSRDGMMLEAAAPILGPDGQPIGVLLGAVLLNRSVELVDKIKGTLYQGTRYRGKDIGTATIFQDDVRIATNVLDDAGLRAVGTRVSGDVYDWTVRGGRRWIGRAFVVNDWYISAYEPILDVDGGVIGMLYVGLLEQKYADTRRGMVLAFLGVTALGTLLSLLASWVISRRMTLSLGQLVRASHEIAAGNLDARVEAISDDEVGELAETFSAMAAALKRRDEQLQELTRARVMKSERLGLIGQLAAGVAHEINNPMQGIVTHAHLMLEELPSDDPKRESLEKIVAQANRCTKIVRGLLDFARAKSSERGPYDVATILDDCLGLVAQQALFQNIEVVREYASGMPPAVVDPSQLQQVFMNLIINAAEAMEGRGRLTVRTHAEPDGELVTVQVADTGHGIRPEDMDKLFAPFFTTKEAGRGTGLGLAISYGIVKEHGGTITAQSAVDEGTTFTVTLPVRLEEGNGDGR